MKSVLIFAATSLVAAQLSAAPAVDWSKLPPASTAAGITFEKDIQPILEDSCVRCHGAQRPRAGLRLDSLEGVMKGTKDGSIVTAGDSANSQLVKAVSQLDPKSAMPPKPRAPRPMGTNAPAMPPHDGGPMGGPGAGGPPPMMGGDAGHGPDGAQGTNGPGMRPRNFGPPPKPLTPEQVGLIRAWIDHGAQ